MLLGVDVNAGSLAPLANCRQNRIWLKAGTVKFIPVIKGVADKPVPVVFAVRAKLVLEPATDQPLFLNL
ncbi:MAG: hypothetical protein R2847_00775 [Bacteroidia bacterium]